MDKMANNCNGADAEVEYGDKLRVARNLLKLSQSVVGSRSGLSQMRVSILENSKRQPTPDEVEALKWLVSPKVSQPTPKPSVVVEVTATEPTAKTAAEICAAIDQIVDSVEVLGDTPELGSAIERLIEAGMWIDRHSRRT